MSNEIRDILNSDPSYQYLQNVIPIINLDDQS